MLMSTIAGISTGAGLLDKWFNKPKRLNPPLINKDNAIAPIQAAGNEAIAANSSQARQNIFRQGLGNTGFAGMVAQPGNTRIAANTANQIAQTGAQIDQQNAQMQMTANQYNAGLPRQNAFSVVADGAGAFSDYMYLMDLEEKIKALTPRV